MSGGVVYILDFGIVRKVGFTRHIEDRVKLLSSKFGGSPKNTFTLFVNNPLGVESAVKRELFNDIKPAAGYFIETFSTPFEKCVSVLKNLALMTSDKPMATRAINYTATMPQDDLEALDAIDGSRSSKILTAVRSYYKI